MSEETKLAPLPRPPHRWPHRLGGWLAELVTVFVGVYAAFFLNYRAIHRQERQRREQLLAWVEERYGGVLDNAQHQTPVLQDMVNRFNAALAAGQTPEIKAMNWTGDYDPSDGTSLLQSGGYELLDIETIRDIREVESLLRQLVVAANRAQQRSDALILPNLDKNPAAFYDPATHRLRASYEWLPLAREDMRDDFKALQDSCTKLLAHVKAERARGR